MNEVGISDARARERAIDPARSFIVQAPAGSGKTELLIQRFLALLAVVKEPEEVRAITFTRKAAAEMRNRIIKALDRAADHSPPVTEHEYTTWELARAALARDGVREWALQQMPGRLRIQTIDSLCHSLTRQMPVTSEMGGIGHIEDDVEELYREAAQATLAEVESEDVYAEPPAILLEHLGNNVTKAEELLVTMLKKRGHWLPLVAGGQERDALERALRGAVEEHLEGIYVQIPDSLKREAVALCRYAVENLLSEGRESPILAAAGLEEFPEPVGEALEAWRGLAALLVTGNGTWRKTRGVNTTIGFPKQDSGGSLTEKELFQSMKEHHAALISTLSEIEGLEEELAQVKDLPPVSYNAEQWGVMQALFELLERAAGHLKATFGRRGVLDHQEVQQRALAALGEEQAHTELAEHLDSAINHILVDEFQDTSRGQFELLERLTAEWTPGEGNTLFVVGDPMQSIYRFREAEVALFLQAWESGIGNVPLEPLILRRNFRSKEEVVSWVNAAFPEVLPAASDAARSAVSYAFCEATRGGGGEVCVHPFFERDDAAEAAGVAAIVSSRLKELDQSDQTIAILVRARTHARAIVEALGEAGISFRGVDLEILRERPEVRDLLALTRALLHPADRTAWLAVLRAPWCGLTLEDLTVLLSPDSNRTVPDLIADEVLVARLSADGRRRLGRLWEVTDTAWKERRRRPLARWVEGVWLALGGPATLSAPTALQSTRVFFNMLQELDQGGDLLDFAALEERADAIFAPPDSSEGIQVEVMTMHAAKGLEFDTVILPGLGRTPRHKDPQALVWLEHPVRARMALMMAPIKGAFHNDEDPVYKFIQRLDTEHAAHELGRLLYVAATRAKDRLHLLGHVKHDPDGQDDPKPDSGSLLQSLWPAVAETFTNRAPKATGNGSPVKDKKAMPLPQSIRRFTSDWVSPLPSGEISLSNRIASAPEREPEEVVEAGNRAARHVGTVVHRALMRIAGDGLSRWGLGAIQSRRSAWEAALRESGVPRDEEEALAERVLSALEQTLRDDRGRWILDDHEEARSEFPLTGLLDGAARRSVVDRTFVEDGVRWIVDFKTGTPADEPLETYLEREKEHYRGQLERYARLFEEEGRPIRLGLYFPLFSAWTEWPFEG